MARVLDLGAPGVRVVLDLALVRHLREQVMRHSDNRLDLDV
jgi:hypothetical protein